MTIAAKDLLLKAATIIQDTTNTRWPAAELVGWLNSGQREVMMYRPDANQKFAPLTLVAGTRQTLPVDGIKLLDVMRNTGGAAIRQVKREILDAQNPGWHTMGAGPIVHFMFDEREPRAFYVYRPAAVGAQVDALYSAYPVDIAAPTAGQVIADVVGDIGLPDIFEGVLTDYVLYRAYSKDAQYAGNGQRAAAHYQQFANALGIEVKATAQFSPTPGNASNPNITPAMPPQ